MYAVKGDEERRAVVLMDDNWSVGWGTGLQVCAVYCDADTGRPCWLAVRATAAAISPGEKLVPVLHLIDRPEAEMMVRVPPAAVWRSPTLQDAPDEICDCVEDVLLRHYVDAVNPVAEDAAWPMPEGCSARRCYRREDLAVALLAMRIDASALPRVKHASMQ